MGLEAVTIAYISAAISVASSVYALVNAPQEGDSGTGVDKKGTQAPRKVPYGSPIIDGVPVYNGVSDINNYWMTNVFSLGVGEINRIRQVYIDDNAVLKTLNTTNPKDSPNYFISSKGNGFVHPINDRQYLYMQFRYGQESETALNLFTKAKPDGVADVTDGEWTTAHRGDRVAQIGIIAGKSKHSDVPIVHSTYSIKAHVDGLSIHDPRYHLEGEKSFTHGNEVPVEHRNCGRNPSLCLLDFILDDYYGLAIDPEYIDEQSFIDTANWCDDNDYFIDGAVNTGESYGDCLSQILSSFNGVLIIEDGLLTVRHETIELPYHTSFDESNVIEFKDLISSNSESYYNVVEIEFNSREVLDKPDNYVIPKDINEVPDGETESRTQKDGFVKTKRIEMTMTSAMQGNIDAGLNAVNKVANMLYAKSHFQRGVTITVDMSDHPDLRVYNVIRISNEIIGWTNKEFRIMNIKRTVGESFNTADLTCSEYSDAIYTGDLIGEIGGKKNRVWKTLEPVTDLAFSLKNFNTDGFGELTWTNPNQFDVNFVVEYKLSSESDWRELTTVTQPSALTPNLKADDYDFRVSCERFGYWASEYTVLANQTVGSILVLPDVTGLVVIDEETQNFKFAWDNMLTAETNLTDPLDPNSFGTSGLVVDYFKHYEVRVYHDNSFVKSYAVTDPEFLYTYADNIKNGTSRNIKIGVTIVAKDASKSNTEVQTTANNTQLPQPSGIGVVNRLGSSTITWIASGAKDFAGTEIHISKTNNFTPSGSTLVTTITGEGYVFDFPTDPVDSATRYVRIGHFDDFDKSNINYSAQESLIYTSLSADYDDSDLYSQIDRLDEEDIQLQTDISTGDANTLASAKEYTDTSVGYCLDDQGNITNEKDAVVCVATAGYSWVEGPISEYIRKLQIEKNGEYASIGDIRQVFETKDGDLVARGGMVSDVNGYVTGWVSQNDGSTSSFDIIADKISFVNPQTNNKDLQYNATNETLEFLGDIVAGSSISSPTITGGLIQTALAGHRVVMSDAIQRPFAIYGTDSDPLLNVDLIDGTYKLTLKGGLTPNTIDNALHYTEAGLIDLRGKLGLTDPLDASGGTIIFDGINNLFGDKEITGHLVGGEDPIGVTYTGSCYYTYAVEDNDHNPNNNEPDDPTTVTITLYYKSSTDDGATWSSSWLEFGSQVINAPSTSTYIDLSQEQGRKSRWTVEVGANVDFQEDLGVVSGRWYRVRAVCTMNTGNNNLTFIDNNHLSGFVASAPVTGSVPAHTHSAVDIVSGTLNDDRLSSNILRKTDSVAKLNANVAWGTSGKFFTNDGGGNIGIRFGGHETEHTQSGEDGSAWEIEVSNDFVNGSMTFNADPSISARGETTAYSNVLTLTSNTKEAHVVGQIKEQGTYLNAKYLGINAQAGDADTVDGYHASTTRNSANTIPVRNSSGYLNLGWINTTSGLTTNASSDYYVNTNDGYIRKKTLANVRTEIMGVSSGSSFLRSDANDTATGYINFQGNIRTDKINNSSGTQLVLNAGESDGKVTGQTGELIYLNAEGGVSINTPSVGNWGGGYAVRTAIITGTNIDLNGNTVWHEGNLTPSDYTLKPNDHTTNNTEYSIVWENNSGVLYTSTSKLKWNPSLGRVTATTFKGALDGTASNADTLDGLNYTAFTRLNTTSPTWGYTYCRRNDNTNAVLYVNQRGTGDIARFFKGDTDTDSTSAKQVTIKNDGSIVTTGGITMTGELGYNGTGNFYIDNETSGKNIQIRTTLSGAKRAGIVVDNTQVYLYQNDNRSLRTINGGIRLGYGDSNFIDVYQRGSTQHGYITNTGGAGNFYIVNQNASKSLYLQVKNTDGTASVPIRAIAGSGSNGYAQLYYGGNERLRTTSAGTTTYGTSKVTGDVDVDGDIKSNGTSYWGDGKEIIRFSDSWLRLNPDNDFTSGIFVPNNMRVDGTLSFESGSNMSMWGSGSDFYMRNKVHGGDVYFQGENSSGVIQTWLRMINSDFLAMYYFNKAVVRTVDNGLRFGDNVLDSGLGYTSVQHDNTHGYYLNSKGILHVRNNAHGGDVYIQSEDSVGTTRTGVAVISGTDVYARLFYNGSTKLQTQSWGTQVLGDLEATANVHANGGRFLSDGSPLIISHEGTNSNTIYLRPNGENNTTGECTLNTSGALNVASTVTGTDCIATSDMRVKYNRQVIENASWKRSQLNGETFNRSDMDGRVHAGVIAQEVQKVLPEGIFETDDEKLGKKLNVSTSAMIGLLVQAGNEDESRITELEKENQELKDRMLKLEAMMEVLK